MTRLAPACVLLAAGTVLLFWFDAGRRAADRAERAAALRIGRLVGAEERADFELIALRVEQGGASWRYEPRDGVWRAVDHGDAVADAEGIAALEKALFEAEGMVASRARERTADYGFDGARMRRVTLEGARGRSVTVDLGLQLSPGEGGYARRGAAAPVWSIDTDPWTALAPRGPEGSPPLLDPFIVPRIWPEGGRRIERIEVEHRAGERIVLTLLDVEVSEAERREGKRPYTFAMEVDGASTPAGDEAAMAFQSFLLAAPWTKVLPAERRAEWAAARDATPLARVRLHPGAEREAATLELREQPGFGTARLVFNDRSGALFEIESEVAALLAPRAADLAPGAPAERWTARLQRP